MAPVLQRALAVALALAHGVAPARAGAPQDGRAAAATITVVVLAPRIDPDTDPLLRERLDGELRVGLARGRVRVADGPADLPDPCDRACLDRLRADTSADYFLRTTVAVNDRDYALRLELLDGKSGELVADSATTCELCGLREFGEAVAAQGALLVAKIDALATPPPALVVATEPPGAIVSVDGVTLGPSPVEKVLTAGKHRVHTSLPGYVPDEREVALVPGVRETLRLSLQRSPAALRLRAVGWASLVVGVPLLAGGVGLLAIAGRDYRPRCAGDDRDLEGDCRFTYTTTPLGATLVVAGALLGVAGAVLLVRTRDRGRVRRVSTSFGPAGLRASF